MSPSSILVLALLAGCGDGAPAAPPARADRHGDPLPPGAYARIGTVRLRQPYVTGLTFSPDGTLLASGGHDNRVVLWNSKTGREVRSLPTSGYVNTVALSADGRRVASGGEKGEIHVWETTTGGEVWHLTHPPQVFTVAFSPDGKLLVSGGLDNAVRVWSLESGKEVKWFQERPGHYIEQVSFAPDGLTLAAARTDRKVDLWDTATWRHQGTLTGHQERVTALAFSADGKTVITGSFDTTIRFWELATRKERHRLGEPKNERSAGDPLVQCLAVSADGKRLATERQQGVIHLWDTTGGRELMRWRASETGVMSMAFAPDGRMLATASRDAIRLWDPATGRRLDPFTGPAEHAERLLFSADGKHVAAYNRQSLRVYETGSLRESAVVTLAPFSLGACAFAPDGRRLAYWENVRAWRAKASVENSIHVLDLGTGREVSKLAKRGGWVGSLAFTPDGQSLWGGCDAGYVVWDVATGKESQRFAPAEPRAAPLSASQDGRLVLLEARDNRASTMLRLWEPLGGRPARTLGQPVELGHRPNWTAFSPDAKAVAIPGAELVQGRGLVNETEVTVYETATG